MTEEGTGYTYPSCKNCLYGSRTSGNGNDDYCCGPGGPGYWNPGNCRYNSGTKAKGVNACNAITGRKKEAKWPAPTD